MSRDRVRQLIGAAVLILMIGYGLCWMQVRIAEAQARSIDNRYTATKVVELAGGICNRVAPGAGFEASEEDFQPASSSSDIAASEWSVESTDPDGQRVICAWNAENGRLIRVSVHGGPEPDCATPITADKAARLGGWWLKDLGMIERASPYRLITPPERNHIGWVIQVERGKHRYIVAVSASGSRLIYAYMRR